MTRPNPATASAWSAGDILLRHGLQFAVTVVLARLLAPEDFGAFALLAFFATFTVVFLQGGLSVALVQCQDTTRDEESAMFWWNLGASIFVGLSFIAAGPLIADFFDLPVLRWLAMTAALQVVLAAASETQIALLTREMRFQVLMRAGLVATPAAGAAAIAAAWFGAGIWALALQGVVYAALNSLVIWASMEWRPTLHLRLATIRKFFALGAGVSAVTALDLAFTSSINLVVGKLFGVRELGYYDRAASTQANFTSSLAGIVGRISLPLLASKQDDIVALKQSVRLAIGCSMLLNVPLLIGVALLAEPLIQVVFGTKWLPAAPILAILALSGIVHPMHLINVHVAVVRGQTRAYITTELIKKGIGVLCAAGGLIVNGIEGLALGLLAYSCLTLGVYALPAYRDLDYGPLKQLRDLSGIFLSALAMTAVVLAVRDGLPTSPLNTLAICSLTGATTYLACGWLSGNRAFRQAFEIFSPLLWKAKPL